MLQCREKALPEKTLIFTFLCNAKGFSAVFGQTGKTFLSKFCWLFLYTCMTKIEISSLDAPANYCV